MDGQPLKLGNGEIGAFILQALIRKLVEKGVLSADDVRTLLFEAAERLTPVGSPLTPDAARAAVISDLLPAILGRA